MAVGDPLDLVPPLPGRLDRGLDGLGAGVHRQRAVLAGHLGQVAKERTHLVVVERAAREREPLELIPCRLHEVGAGARSSEQSRRRACRGIGCPRRRSPRHPRRWRCDRERVVVVRAVPIDEVDVLLVVAGSAVIGVLPRRSAASLLRRRPPSGGVGTVVPTTSPAESSTRFLATNSPSTVRSSGSPAERHVRQHEERRERPDHLCDEQQHGEPQEPPGATARRRPPRTRRAPARTSRGRPSKRCSRPGPETRLVEDLSVPNQTKTRPSEVRSSGSERRRNGSTTASMRSTRAHAARRRRSELVSTEPIATSERLGPQAHATRARAKRRRLHRDDEGVPAARRRATPCPGCTRARTRGDLSGRGRSHRAFPWTAIPAPAGLVRDHRGEARQPELIP